MRDEHNWLEQVGRWFQREPKNREDLLALLRSVKEMGIIDTEALAMIEGALQISQMRVSHIMIPRSQMIAIHQAQTLEASIAQVIESAHSRFPVLDENNEQVVGILLAKDLLRLIQAPKKDAFEWDEYLRPAMVVPESKRLDRLLQEFRRDCQHMAIVVDEYGVIAGLVTLEDILEQIVGEIDDEYDVDADKNYVKPQTNGSFAVKAIMPLKKFNEYFESTLSTEGATTIGGFLLNQWHRLPKRNESIQCGALLFTILHADHRRLHLLSVKKV